MVKKRRTQTKVFPVVVDGDNLCFVGGTKRKLTAKEEGELRSLLFARLMKNIGVSLGRSLGKFEFNKRYMTEAKIER